MRLPQSGTDGSLSIADHNHGTEPKAASALDNLGRPVYRNHPVEKFQFFHSILTFQRSCLPIDCRICRLKNSVPLPSRHRPKPLPFRDRGTCRGQRRTSRIPTSWRRFARSCPTALCHLNLFQAASGASQFFAERGCLSQGSARIIGNGLDIDMRRRPEYGKARPFLGPEHLPPDPLLPFQSDLFNFLRCQCPTSSRGAPDSKPDSHRKLRPLPTCRPYV